MKFVSKWCDKAENERSRDSTLFGQLLKFFYREIPVTAAFRTDMVLFLFFTFPLNPSVNPLNNGGNKIYYSILIFGVLSTRKSFYNWKLCTYIVINT